MCEPKEADELRQIVEDLQRNVQALESRLSHSDSGIDKTRQPQTSPIDPQDPRFLQWQKDQHEAHAHEIRTAVPSLMRPPGDGGDGGGGGGGSGGGTTPAPPLTSFHAYVNYRSGVDWNTCGQAAIGSMTDFYHKNPYNLPRDFFGFWNDGRIIDAVIQGGFGPDEIFGWGTSPGRIGDALRSYGIAAEVRNSGLFFSGWQEQWNRLLAYVYYSALPVPVLVDLGLLGGPAFSAHWPVLWKMEYSSSDMLLYFGNWSIDWASLPITATRFLDAWACRQLPLGNNHAGVYCGTPRIQF